MTGVTLIPGENWFPEYNNETIQQVIVWLKKIPVQKNYGYKVLFVFDDAVVWLKAEGARTAFWKFVANRRHLINSWKYGGKSMSLSYIITGQKFKMFPQILRMSTSGWILFRITPIEFKVFHNEICYDPTPLKELTPKIFKYWGTESNTHRFCYFSIFPTPYTWFGFRHPLPPKWDCDIPSPCNTKKWEMKTLQEETRERNEDKICVKSTERF